MTLWHNSITFSGLFYMLYFSLEYLSLPEILNGSLINVSHSAELLMAPALVSGVFVDLVPVDPRFYGQIPSFGSQWTET